MKNLALLIGLALSLSVLSSCPAAQPPPASPAESDVDYYTCPMHPSVHQDRPGQCPICHMTLVPVKHDERGVVVDDARRAAVGIKTEKVARAPFLSTVRALGHVAVDETGLRDVTVRSGGFVDDVAVDQTGMKVKQGQTLFTLTSPELVGAQSELARALASGDAGLVAAARRRLELLGFTKEQLDALVAGDHAVAASDRVAIVAPQSGVVVEKDLVAGSRVEAGQRVLRIARLDKVWVEADVPTSDVAGVKPGMSAKLRSTSSSAAAEIKGVVARVLPSVNPGSRTATVRIDVKNGDGALIPGAAVDVELDIDAAPALSIPSSAVVYTGERRVVFVQDAASASRFLPRDVQLGRKSADTVEVTQGLAEGDVVVVSGTFLVAAEARIRGIEP